MNPVRARLPDLVRRSSLVASIAVLMCGDLAACQAAQDAAAAPQNLRFEVGQPGGPPDGWRVSSGYAAKLTTEQAKEGMYCVELAWTPDAEGSRFGTLRQAVDAAAYRNKRIRYRAAVRVEGTAPADRAQLWLRVDRMDGQMGFFDNMAARPIRSSDWGYYEIVGDVDSNATRIVFGILLYGSHRVWVDDASLEIVGGQPAPSADGR